MSLVLQPYATYKDSGVPWLGEVPTSWDVLPAVAAYKPKLERNTRLIEKIVLSLSYGRIVVKPEEKLHGLVPGSFETYQVVDPGDIIVRTTDLQNDKTSLRIGHSSHRGIITSAYMCLEATDRISNEFGYQFLNAHDLLKIIYGFGSGLRQNLGFADIKRMPVLVPPKAEQLAIVRFLSHADRRISQFILAKQNLIKLLEEQELTIVNRTITCGLDRSVRFKPSRVDWVSEMPEHWSATRLKFTASDIVDCLHATPVYSESGEYPAIRTADIIPGKVLIESARRVDQQHYLQWTQRLKPAAGDVLYTREGGRFGFAALVPSNVSLCISQRMMLFRIKDEHSPAYIMWQLNCQHVYAQAVADLIGGAAPHVNVERIKNYWLLLPPRREQDQIVAAIERDTAAVSAAIQQAKREIQLVREYRTRLIADVVTGKIDVREAAAKLPDVVDEPDELLVDANLVSDNDEEQVADELVGEEAVT